MKQKKSARPSAKEQLEDLALDLQRITGMINTSSANWRSAIALLEQLTIRMGSTKIGKKT